MKTQLKKGFTLVEIMIVVVIIGLLAALAIPAFKKVRNNAIEKSLVNDARQISSAVNQIMSENACNNVGAKHLCKYLAGGKLSAGVAVVSSTNTAPASGLVTMTGDASGSAVIPANTLIGTVGTDGTVTAGTGVLGTFTQGNTFILGHTNFDKTLSSNAKVSTSAPSGKLTQVTFEVDTGAVSEATAATGSAS